MLFTKAAVHSRSNQIFCSTLKLVKPFKKNLFSFCEQIKKKIGEYMSYIENIFKPTFPMRYYNI